MSSGTLAPLFGSSGNPSHLVLWPTIRNAKPVRRLRTPDRCLGNVTLTGAFNLSVGCRNADGSRDWISLILSVYFVVVHTCPAYVFASNTVASCQTCHLLVGLHYHGEVLTGTMAARKYGHRMYTMSFTRCFVIPLFFGFHFFWNTSLLCGWSSSCPSRWAYR